MDLRRRLITRLGLLLGGLMAVATAIQLYSLRSDIDAEVRASARVVGMLAAADAPGAPFVSSLQQAGIRHLRIRAAGQPAAPEQPHPLLALLGLSPGAEPGQGEQEIRIGGQTLTISPNPDSEISERLRDTVRIWITLLFFSGTTLFVAWWAADRALRPVRALEEGLQRLARGERDPALPAFALREFKQVAGAIEGLARALDESQAAQHALARQLISVQENERSLLARELHDDMGQALTALNATATHLARNAEKLGSAEVAECASDMRFDIRAISGHIRAILKDLRPHGLHASGLAQALRELADSWRGRGTGIEFTLSLEEPAAGVTELTAVTAYRVVQEALTNVVRHSHACHCSVLLACNGSQLRIEVADDGRGLPEHGVARRGGLQGMLERVGMAGGELTLSRGPAGGLRLVAALPVHCAGHAEMAVWEGEAA